MGIPCNRADADVAAWHEVVRCPWGLGMRRRREKPTKHRRKPGWGMRPQDSEIRRPHLHQQFCIKSRSQITTATGAGSQIASATGAGSQMLAESPHHIRSHANGKYRCPKCEEGLRYTI